MSRLAHDPEGQSYARRIWGIAIGTAVFAACVVAVAMYIGSRQLLKDGFDWSYDVVLFAMSAIVYGRSAQAERVCALLIAVVLAVAGLHTLYDLWDKIVDPRPIEPVTLGFSALSAALFGVVVVALLLRFRRSDNPLIHATWISSRNAMISTALYSSVSLFARLATSRHMEYGLDVFAAGLCFQGAYVITRDVMRDARKRRAAVVEA
ncbi:MAG: hypothetical protein K2X62_10135 [Beijerinckiaceae bacterium]|jgi:Co/Zn/Cd efflux system component|nr:hypothetical protein [Beijerinckiaceae bacterium]